MKINNILIILLVFSITIAQNQFNIKNLLDYGDLKYAPNSPKPYTGKVFDLYPDGIIQMEGMYKKGKKNGKWTYYSKLGKILFYNMFLDGMFSGDTLYTASYSHGKVLSKVPMINGKKNGLMIEYFDGIIRRTQNFNEGIESGYFSKHNRLGEIYLEGYLEDNTIKFFADKWEIEKAHLENRKIAIPIFSDGWDHYDEDCSCYVLPALNGRIVYDDDWQDEDFEGDVGEWEWADWDSPPPPDENEDFEFVAYDQAPSPKFGKGIFDFLVYPKIVKEAGIEGKVFVKFYIDKKGNVDPNKITIIEGIPALNDAAILAVRKSKWKPAQQRDMRVGTYLTMPIIFEIER